MTMPAPLAPYTISAFNTAHDSENKIHDDATARRFGFGGGLVPGVDVYGYMSHMPVMRWGRAWLERGTAECRFFKPVYDGNLATVTAQETADGLDIAVESQGENCATGRASLPAGPSAIPKVESFHHVPQRASRPPADEKSLPANGWLGLDPYVITAEMAAEHRANLRESATLYAEEGLVHPGTVLRACNFLLSRNVVLGPWIHVGSRIQNLAAARIGEPLSGRARITANYEHKGHLFVDLDALVLAGEGSTLRPIAHVAHISIYRPRQVSEK
jgi:hypothetical protein